MTDNISAFLTATNSKKLAAVLIPAKVDPEATAKEMMRHLMGAPSDQKSLALAVNISEDQAEQWIEYLLSMDLITSTDGKIELTPFARCAVPFLG